MNTNNSDTDLAYLAGIIDGEGTITIGRAPRNNTKHRVPYHIPHVKVCNTNKELIDWIHAKFGGRMNNTRQANAKWSTLYYIRWNCGKARDLLEAILPYLRVKKLQGTIVLEFIKRMNKKSFTGVMLSEEERGLREKMYSLVTALNRRGPQVDAERLSEEASQFCVRDGAIVRTCTNEKVQESGGNIQTA